MNLLKLKKKILRTRIIKFEKNQMKQVVVVVVDIYSPSKHSVIL
jgi:hypothetical protein